MDLGLPLIPKRLQTMINSLLQGQVLNEVMCMLHWGLPIEPAQHTDLLAPDVLYSVLWTL